MAATIEPLSPVGREAARRRRALLVIAAVAIVLLVLVYGFAVHTRWGQRLDSAAIRGRHVLSPRDIRVARRVHEIISIASVVLLGSAVCLVALARRRVRLAFGVGVMMVGALLTTEVLKRTLPRPDLGVLDPLRSPSFPSGHTTIAMALSVGAVMVAPVRHRAVLAILGVAFSATIGWSLIITASHRPSDPIGAALVVTAWSATAAAMLIEPAARRHRHATWLQLPPYMALAGGLMLAGAFLVVSVVAVAVESGRIRTVPVGRTFAAAGASIIGAILLCTAVILLAIGDEELDRPARL